MRSMTGFGKAAASAGALRIEAEVRSVNHRYLKVVFRLPPQLSGHEAELETFVRERIGRGSVTVVLRSEGGDRGTGWALDPQVVQTYREGVMRAFAAVGAPVSPARALELVLSLPGVVAPPREDGADHSWLPPARDALEAALAELTRTRELEGSHLATTLGDHVARLNDSLATARRLAKDIPARHRDRMFERVQRLLAEVDGTPLETASLHREICLLADRLDVSEELSRAAGHLERLGDLVRVGGASDPVGRPIEFLLQELQREVNTLGSKSNDAELAHEAIAMKVEIERMREQVQNVE